MRTAFLASFLQDLRGVRDRATRERIRALIAAVEQGTDLRSAPRMERICGGEPCFRIRVGDHHAGVRVEADTVTFVRILPRAELYFHLP